MRTDRRSALRALLSLATLTPLAASAAHCSRRESAPGRPRCAFCGMRIPAGSHWAAGARAGNGSVLAFDTPACLFRYRQSPRGAGTSGEWVTEYYGPAGRQTDARAVRYVTGSDVIGPMGPDVIPVDPARAEGFVRDHHGQRQLTFDEVTSDVIQRL